MSNQGTCGVEDRARCHTPADECRRAQGNRTTVDERKLFIDKELDDVVPLHVGELAVTGRAWMAPMVGYNEGPLRRLCRRFGSALAITEMIKPEKLLRGDPALERDLTYSAEERPLGAQLALREPELLVPAARRLAARGFDLIDLNVGCPLRKETGKGWGAAVLSDPDRLARLVDAVVAAVDVPVTVKLRAGYELGELTAPAAARAAVAAGAAMVCVHGRTKMGWYREPNRLSAIAAVVDAVGGAVPVVGNGDVTSLDAARTLFERTGCDAVMVGRGAVGNPWLFAQIDAFVRRGELLPLPSLADVRALYGEHLDGLIEERGPRRGFSQGRRYAFHYFGRFGLTNDDRRALATAKTRPDLDALLDRFAERAGPRAAVA